MKTILVLDECCGPSVYKPVTYSGFLSPDELKGEIRLIIITSLNGLSLEDKERCLDYKEIELPTANGMLECHALRFHKLYGIDVVYTKQEDLILRAAHIRRLLGLKEGMLPDLALLYRDKERMKTRLQSNGFPVPNFNRVHSPVDILSFAETHGFPVIVKPTLGQASAGIRLIHDNADLEKYLESEFYERLSDRMMDYSGDMLIEQFVPGKMFHVNGYAKNGKIEIVWPFAYVSTNLDFTKGKAYGNVLIAQSDELFKPLVEATQRVINILGAPEHLIFHAELFQVEKSDGSKEFLICEIAARRPGGSIGLLIDEAEGGKQLFPEMEFRLNVGLSLRHDRSTTSPLLQDRAFTIGDIMIPKQIGKLKYLPGQNDCNLTSTTQYIPIAKVDTLYHGFDVNSMNTAARFVVRDASVGSVEERLLKALDWFQGSAIYESLPLPLLPATTTNNNDDIQMVDSRKPIAV